MSSVKADVGTILHFLYAILGAILVKGVIDMLRNKPIETPMFTRGKEK